MKVSILKFSTFFAVLFSAPGLGSPTVELEKRTPPPALRPVTICGQYEQKDMGPYSINNDLWGMGSGSGSQCTTITGSSNDAVSWSTKWQWNGNPNQVKSYANAFVLLRERSRLIKDVKSIPTRWHWNYTASHDAVADVAYDLFTSDQCPQGGQSPKGRFEIMIWLHVVGHATPIGKLARVVTFEELSWEVWEGYNPDSYMSVISFFPVSPGQGLENFDSDLAPFLKYLTYTILLLPPSQCLYVISAGTEAFIGGSESTFTTTEFHVDIS